MLVTEASPCSAATSPWSRCILLDRATYEIPNPVIAIFERDDYRNAGECVATKRTTNRRLNNALEEHDLEARYHPNPAYVAGKNPGRRFTNTGCRNVTALERVHNCVRKQDLELCLALDLWS